MDTVFEISKLLQYSPKRMSLFKEMLLVLEFFVQPDGQYVMKPFVVLLITIAP